MTDQPGCPCSICDADYADTKRLQINASVDVSLRDRIATAIQGVDDWRGVTDPAILADAVIAGLGKHESAAADIARNVSHD
jgi:hypothetical protein